MAAMIKTDLRDRAYASMTCSRYTGARFPIALMDLRTLYMTYLRMPPSDLNKIRVLVTTACSDCSETARTAMRVPGNMKPFPMLEGIRKSGYNQSDMPFLMKTRPLVPASRRMTPTISGGLRRPVHVMMKLVAVPAAEEHNMGTTRRRPELVALSKRTAWK